MVVFSEVKLITDHVALIKTSFLVTLVKPASIIVCALAIRLLAVCYRIAAGFGRLKQFVNMFATTSACAELSAWNRCYR